MLTFYVPKPEEMWFKQKMLADEATMSYNRAWGGTIPFPEDKWSGWYDRWIARPEGKRFYRYLKDENGQFVGEAAYHWDEDVPGFMADVLIYAPFRGKGHGSAAAWTS